MDTLYPKPYPKPHTVDLAWDFTGLLLGFGDGLGLPRGLGV